MNGRSSTRRSNQRFTVTIGEDAIRRARSSTPRSAAGSSSNRSCSANHGTLEITRPACHVSPAARTPTTAAPSGVRTIFAAAPVRTALPWLSRYCRAGSAYIRCSGLVGSAIAAARGSSLNISASTRANGGAAARSGGWFSAASASGSQSSSRSRAVWPLRISQFSTVSSGEAARTGDPRNSRRAFLSGVAIPSSDSRSRHDSASHSSTPATRCSGGGSAAQFRRVRVPIRSIIVTASCGSRRTLSCAPMSRRKANVSV